MKKTKKIDQELLDLETTMNFAKNVYFKDFRSTEAMDLYIRAKNDYCNEIQRRKDSKPTQAFRPVVSEYKIIK